MFRFYMIPGMVRTGTVRLLAATALWWLAASVVHAAVTFGDVQVVNVTPSSFSMVWTVSENSTPGVQIYSDPRGTNNLAGTLGVEWYPLNAGSPLSENVYYQRQEQQLIRDETKGFRLVMVRITGCSPSTSYHYRLQARGQDGQTYQLPRLGLLPSVKTSGGVSFVAEARQLVITIPGTHILGRVVTLTSTNAFCPLASVVGDGAATNQVVFNMADLMSADGSTNLNPIGDQFFNVELMGPSVGDMVRQYSLNFSGEFAVAEVDQRSFVLDSLTLNLGERAVYAGQSDYLPITLSCNVPVTNVVFDVVLPNTRLTNFAVTRLGIPAATMTMMDTNRARISLNLFSSKTYLTETEVARLTFTAPSNQVSAFLPVPVENLQVKRPSGLSLDVSSTYHGRVVVVGEQPILEALRPEDGKKVLMMYGHTNTSYRLESTPNLRLAFWPNWMQVSLTNISQKVDNIPAYVGNNRFFRAREQ